ncbi:hypothetical protein X805_28160 [Sphaerotilus natans subsp. natans DSM 6575]|uniref:Uncharacterized protein n=1 Tax=Sphaerotilus natans subsp. natans DSM 6575 TaxID=1286631 RepID=A0A059KJJ6_9BURK|nr:hypothetical protein X805_28160 [Sphaerotilus natans subsp. natans DSM 6575]
MLEKHEAQPGIDRKLCEQQAQAFQPAGRRSHANEPRQHRRALRFHLHVDRLRTAFAVTATSFWSNLNFSSCPKLIN